MTLVEFYQKQDGAKDSVVVFNSCWVDGTNVSVLCAVHDSKWSANVRLVLFQALLPMSHLSLFATKGKGGAYECDGVSVYHLKRFALEFMQHAIH